MSTAETTGAIVVAIDGPSGVGKSTVAKQVARALRLSYLDTGAMYRALGLAALRSGVSADDAAAVAGLVDRSHLELTPAGDGSVLVTLDGEPVEPYIRSQKVAEMASRLAAQKVVRQRLVDLQRAFGARYGAVLEGRDIGTVVFPTTPHKFFLDARHDVRVGRRAGQLGAADAEATARVAEEIAVRDRRDRERAESPLVCDESYQRLDTSDVPPEEVTRRIVAAVSERAARR